jgi:putative hemolysin
MSPTVFIILATFPVLIAASAFCSASETALFGLSYNDRLQLRRLRPRAGAAADSLLASPRALLITILILNLSVNALIFALSSVLVLHIENAALGAAVNTACVIALIVFGEVLPKMLAGSGRVTFCRYLAPIVLRLYRVFSPISRVLELGVIGPLSRLFRPEDTEPRARSVANLSQSGALDVQDLERLLELGASQGTIDRDEQSLIAQVVEIGHRRVYDVMTPRTDIRWIDRAASTEAAIMIIRQSGHRYLPVFIRSADEQIIGFLDARRFVAAWAAGKPRSVESCLFPVTYVPENARLDQLLEHFRVTNSEITLCVDEHGTVDGLVSIADVARRFVEEPDTSETTIIDLVADPSASGGGGSGGSGAAAFDTNAIRRLDAGRWSIPGRMSVHHFAQLFDVATDPRVSTVAGLITVSLGRIPSPGDHIRLDSLELKVESIARNMVERVEVREIDTDERAASSPLPLPPPRPAGKRGGA